MHLLRKACFWSTKLLHGWGKKKATCKNCLEKSSPSLCAWQHSLIGKQKSCVANHVIEVIVSSETASHHKCALKVG